MPQKKVLVLFAHPSHKQSEVNLPLFQAAQSVEGVTAIDLYHEYPRFNINIDKEQQRLRDHDVVIFQFPMYWYSTPAILKEWQDLVLEYGFAYGSTGTELHGKYFMCATSAGGKEEAYCTDGFNHFTVGELLQPLQQMSSLTGMIYLAPFVLFGSRTASEENRINSHAGKYQTLLTALVEDKVDLEAAASMKKITNDLSPLLKEDA